MTWGLIVIGLALLVYALVSRLLDGSPITAPMFFVGIGLLVGPKVLDKVSTPSNGHSVRILAEATLALVLFADASRIDLTALRREYAVPLRLLAIGLPLTIIAGAGVAVWLFSGLTFIEAIVLGILLAPTDAALGQAVVSLPSLPSRVRQGLNVESGLNDGICVPLLLIALAAAEAQAGATSDSQAIRVVGEEIGYGLLGGVLAGAVAAAVVIFARRRDWITPAWLQIVPVAGAGLAYGIADHRGGSGFIAAFTAGLVYGALQRVAKAQEAGPYLLDQTGDLLDAVTFLVFGAVLLEPRLTDITWEVALYALVSLTLVRMLPVALAMLGMHAKRPTVAFLGWFGPRGLASIVFAVIVVEEAHLPGTDTILLVTYVTVGLSVLLHGLTASPLAARYSDWYRSRSTDELPPPMESVAVAAHRWRSDAQVPTGP